jgi:Haem-NO-binding
VIILVTHGLINRAIQTFLRDTYGAAIWRRIAQEAGLGFDNFEPMLLYRRAQTVAVIKAAARILNRSPDSLLEDLGTALVARGNTDPVRRLMRFGGVTFVDFLHSLEELRGRGRMAVPELDLPDLQLDEAGPQIYRLTCTTKLPGAAHVLTGLLRAMADDYGALVLLEYEGRVEHGEAILVHLLDQNHATARRFDLATPRS